MKLIAKDLREIKMIDIQGHEPWLGEIYSSFQGTDCQLHGKIVVKPEAYGVYALEGHVDFTPLVECSRCQEPLGYPIHRDFSIRFIDRDAAEADFEIEGMEDDGEEFERDLVSEDLDTYYIEKTGELDIEMVVNDFIQTALPTRVTCASVDKACGMPLQNHESGLIHKDKADVDMSPFAALKHLKLPDA